MAEKRIFFEITVLPGQGFDVLLKDEEKNALGNGILPKSSGTVIDSLKGWQTAFVETTKAMRMTVTRNAASEDELKKRQSEASKEASERVNDLKHSLNEWLKEDKDWQKTFLLVANQGEVNPVIVQTDDTDLWKYPWSEWDLLGKAKAEVAFGLRSKYEGNKRLPNSTEVRILAVLGDDEGIDSKFDKKVLEQYAPQAEVEIKFLPQPKKEKLLEHLRDEKGWHIFFFAGHSGTDEKGNIGSFKINKEDPLTITDLKEHFEIAVEKGLQLAIFNSCDGVGLAKQLAELNLPQSIVMRLPVPDNVAKLFLKEFLEHFAKQGMSLYAAVYETRRVLTGVFKDKYPGVGWLPMICQNPAAEVRSWEEWVQEIEKTRESQESQKTQENQKTQTRIFNGVLLAVLLPVVGYGSYPVWLDMRLATVGMKQVTYEYEVRSYSDRVDYKWEDMNKTEGQLSLYEGDSYKIRYTPQDDSYVYVYQWSDRGKVDDLVSEYKMERQVKGGQENMIPPDNQGRRLVLAPTGVRKICVLAFKQPNPYLDQQVVKDDIITGNSQLQYYLWDPRDYLDKNCPTENKVTFENKGPDRPSP